MVKNEAIEEFVQAIQQPQAQSGTTYSAIVARIDDEGVVWVNLAGSDKETPTASVSSEVEKGDSVTVEWRNNKLYIAGNYSNPSAGTARVSVVEKDASIARKSAEQAVNEAVRAYEAAEQAVYDAGRAAEAAESAEANALASAQSASSAQQSASSAGISASQAQAASQAAQAAALGSITTDTLHYLATDLDSGVTTANPPAGHGTWSTTVQTMTETNKYLWTYHTYTTAGGSSTDTSPIITGTYGERGEDGTSVTILGSYDTLAELQAAHPTGSLGDAYMVGGDLYVWNGSAWENVGQIQGPQGPQGIQGNSITISSIAYAVTATEDAPLTYPYSTVPIVPEGSWLWTRTTYSDGNVAILKAKQGAKGSTPTITTTKNGKTTTIYADGASIGTVIDGTDGSSPTVSKSGDTVTITDASGNIVTVKDGEDGASIKGDDGEDAYFHIAWANSSDGTVDFSTSVALNKLYMGTYTDHTQTDSQTPSKYKWVKVKGEQGVQGPQGQTGATGDDGVSVTAVQPQYYLSTSDASATGGSWSTSLTYVVGKFIWTRDYITYSDNSHSTSTEIYNEALTQSCEDAAEALGLIEEQQEYFWHDSLGAHVLSDKDTVSGTRYRTDIKGAGLEIFELDGQNDVSVAQFGGSGVRVGKTTGGHTTIQTSGMQIYGSDGTKQLANIGYGDGKSSTGTTAKAPYYTLGGRLTNSGIGNYSMAEGIGTTASDYASHAEGNQTTASGYASHAEGYDTTASGRYAHAEGGSTTVASGDYGSHAEGARTTASGDYGAHSEGMDTTASGDYGAHAEGYYSVAEGDYSHAQNLYTFAGYYAQTAIGKYNDNDSNNAFEIGNGTLASTRSNAFAVAWDGNVRIDLANYQSTEDTTDKAIYSALYSLGWLNEVTENDI